MHFLFVIHEVFQFGRIWRFVVIWQIQKSAVLSEACFYKLEKMAMQVKYINTIKNCMGNIM